MLRFRSFAALSAALILLFSSAAADGAGSDAFQADDLDISFEDLVPESPDLSADETEEEAEDAAFTPLFTPALIRRRITSRTNATATINTIPKIASLFISPFSPFLQMYDRFLSQ